MRARKFIPAILYVFALGTGTASASPLEITDLGCLSGNGWINPLPVVGVIQNQGCLLTDSIYWGDADDILAHSGYQFTPVNPADPVALYSPFLLGTFAHINQPISGDIIGSVQYSFGFSINGAPNSLNTIFQFNHDETSNGAPCPTNPLTNAPSVSDCDDFVMLSHLLLNESFVVGNDMYFFNLLGFSADGGNTFTNVLQTQENGNNVASLYGVVTPVPEPSSLLLLGTGLVVVARRIRRARGSSQFPKS